jgi:DNA repair protein RecO (recombination protein O)
MSLYKETTGYIIHQRSFKDSSLILEFYSQDDGLLHLLAKGIKTNKKLNIHLQYFSLLKVQYFGKSQLKTISQINVIENRQLDGLIEKTAGLYLNEIIRYSVLENQGSLALFNCYRDVIQRLGTQKLAPLLRGFEKELLKYNGFELSVDSFTNTEAWLTVDENLGLQLTNKKAEKLCQVGDLKRFLSGQKLVGLAQKRLNKLMLKMMDMSLSYRKIYSREMLKSITSK